jgi:hypothetical protein
MSDVKHNTLQAPQHHARNGAASENFGRNHQDIDDDLAALKSVMGIPAFSSGLKQLKNSFTGLKSLFTN